MSSALEITEITSASMTLSDGSVWRFLTGKPQGWEVGDNVNVKKNYDPAPGGGPVRFKSETLLQAMNLTKKAGPISVTSAGSVNPPTSSTPKKDSYSLDDIKLETKYAIQEIYPNEDSFLLECGKFMIDRLTITSRQKLELKQGDIVILHPSASMRGDKKKFMVENLSRETAKFSVLFIS